MSIAWFVIIALIEGSICYVIAQQKGLRYPRLWFVGGIVAQVFAFAALYYAVKVAPRAQEE